jgi:hypothetical protein
MRHRPQQARKEWQHAAARQPLSVVVNLIWGGIAYLGAVSFLTLAFLGGSG